MEKLMKTAGMLGNIEIMSRMNKFLNQFDIEIAYDMEEILNNISNINSYSDIEAIIIYDEVRPKEQHKKLLYNIRSVLPNTLLVWCCKEQDRDEQFEVWAFSAVNLKHVLYINEKGEIPVNRLVDTLNAEHARLLQIEEAKKLKLESEASPTKDKQLTKQKIVERVVEKKIIVEKEVIVDRPTVVKGLLKIATFSVSGGAGSTSMAIKLGEQLSKYGKTAIIEVDKSASLQYAKPVANCEYRVLNKPEDLGDALYELYRSGFNLTVTDYGCLFNINSDGSIDETDDKSVNRVLLKEFIKADVKIGMAFTAPWQIEKLKFFLPGNMIFEGLCGRAHEELCFLTDGEVSKADKLLGIIKCFDRDIDMGALVETLLPDIAVNTKQQKRHGIFNLLTRSRTT